MLAQVPDAQNRNDGITGSSFLGAVLPVLVHSDERTAKLKPRYVHTKIVAGTYNPKQDIRTGSPQS